MTKQIIKKLEELHTLSHGRADITLKIKKYSHITKPVQELAVTEIIGDNFEAECWIIKEGEDLKKIFANVKAEVKAHYGKIKKEIS